MKVNIFVEDFRYLKYLGCATAAKTLYKQLSGMPGIEVSFNSKSRDFDIVHYHTLGPLALLNLKYSRGINVLTAHVTPRLNDGGLAFSKYLDSYYPYCYRKFDHIITLVDWSRREVKTLAPDVPATTIPNGVDRNYFKRDEKKRARFRKRYNISGSEKVVLAAGQQTPRKGIYDFIELSKMHPEMRWVWVGGFPAGPLSKDHQKIEKMKKECGNKVIFTGFVPDIAEAYSGADVFLMPSYSEIFVLVVLEALSCGLPVVARKIPDFTEIFGDVALFFGNLEEAGALLADDELLLRISKKSRAFTKQYDIKQVAKMHFELYKKLTDGNGRIRNRSEIISVVIPTYNEEANIESCLKSLCRQTLKRSDYEIIVVDGNSTDKTLEIAKKYADKAIIQKSKKVGGARNDGIMLAKGRIVATTDADCIIPPNWLETIRDDFEKNDIVQLYGLVYPREKGLKHKISLAGANTFSKIGYYTKTYYHTLGCNTAFDKQAFIKAGMYRCIDAGDDVEIALRMKKLGRVMLDKKLKVGFSMRRYEQFGTLKSLYEWLYIASHGGNSEKFSYSKREYKQPNPI